MPLDWLNTPLDADIGELLARKKRAKAIEALRQQLQGRLAPPVAVRLQLADLLMQAGRADEASPVLLGLADEFAADGFVAKAVAILKRVDRAQPGRADVAERLEKLVHQQKRVADLPSRPRSSFPEFGMEEIEAEPALGVEGEPATEAMAEPVELSPEAGPVTAESAPTAADASSDGSFEVVDLASEPGVGRSLESGDPRDAMGEVSAEPVAGSASEAPIAESTPEAPLAEAPAASEPDVAVSPAGPGDSVTWEPLAGEAVVEPDVAELGADLEGATGPGVGRRIRRALWRFLASLPGAEEGALVALPPGDSEEGRALPEEVPVEAAAAEAVSPEPEVASPEPEVASTEPAPPATPEQEPDEADETMTEEVFRDHLLDIVEDVLHRPPAQEEAVPMDRERVLDLARRLVASRLFHALSDEELLAIVRGLRLRTFEAGDVVVTEGEPGQSLFTLTTGSVKVFVRNPDGRNFEVATLAEGDFFGEISSLSGRPRTATVVAAGESELLELDRPTLDSIARTHARVRDVLETSYIERAGSASVAAVRAVPLPDEGTRRKADDVLEAHFGESRWDPRMRLRLADVLLKAGKDEDAVAILVGLADELAREGYADKAVAILKKIEQVQRRDVEVVNLAPLLRGERVLETAAAPPRPPGPRLPAATDDRLHGWLVDLVRDTVAGGQASTPASPEAARPRAYGPGLLANPLFEDFSEEELLAFIRGLRLLVFEPGDVIVTEGEPGQSVFILTTGRVKVFVRGPDHRDVLLGPLGEGSFFGEISTLSGRPRSATITAAAPCEILELDRETLDGIARTHPRVRSVLEAFSEARRADPEAHRARGGPPAEGA
ncbi:MAG TPA: cyclic nucleotide-binding domain-containing protein [Vicinamibacteria bacterium]|nr:cyclic nucleotide-binding domain-containing protein [Vicinamibacteria bacterium]